ncbi:MAG: hypothetical protein FWB86_05480 [Treponema sp.]|nr:hypothetical protein [Treponema sp.]
MSLFLIFLLFFVSFSPVNGLDLPVSRISDDSILRNNLKDAWFLDTARNVLARNPRIEYLETGERVQVSATEGREEFIVIISREQMSGIERRASGNFPGWAQGSWMLTRRKDTGAGTLIRIFLRSDQNTHIQFRPFDNEKCLMDAVVYGAYLTRSLPVAVPFERLYTMPLNDIIKLIEGKFPLKYFEPDIAIYKDTRTFISLVREKIIGLRFADDGAIDENGNYVLIKTLQQQTPSAAGLNCSGFAKWLIDGMLRPVTGKRLQVTPLSAPFGDRGSSFTVNWEERKDVFFGLDWIRNLAAQANTVLRSPAYGVLDEFEIRNNNFSLIRVNQNRTFIDHTYPGFLPEAGYGIEGLRPLLYTLAIEEPYSFYLAAVNTEFSTPTSLRGTPRLRQYFHIAALVPYFDEYGTFGIAVFESAAETSFNAFRNRYPRHFVNLVKIPVTNRFEP